MTRRRLLLRATVIAALVILATGVAFAIAFPPEVYDLDAPQSPTPWSRLKRTVAHHVGQVVLPLIYDERTTYGAGFREATFQTLKVGMPEDEVVSALGQPLMRRPISDGRSILYYSQQATPRDNYLVRNVVLDSNGRLVDVHADFYVD